MNGTSKKEKILVYLKANPNMSTIQVAKALGVRKEYVYNIKSAEGMTKPRPINGAMKDAITNALADTKPAATKVTKPKVVGVKDMVVNLQIEMTHGTLIMNMNEAKELYGVLKPLLGK